MLSRTVSLLLVPAALGAIQQEQLCGEWTPTTAADCGSTQLCPGETTPSFNAQDSFQFASDGTYSQTFLMSTGGCPITQTNGNLVLEFTTFGTYDIGNDASVAGYTEFTFTPEFYMGALKKNQKEVFFAEPDAPNYQCRLPVDMLMDPTDGCPCNGTWVSGASYDVEFKNWTDSRTFARAALPTDTPFANRKVEVCPTGTCPNTFFFKSDVFYANVAYENSTSLGRRTLNMTETSTDSSVGWGYGDADIKYTFEALSNRCIRSVDPANDATPTPDSTPKPSLGPGAVAVPALAWAVAALAAVVPVSML